METLGRYKVLKEIGRGSMGVIYLGFDPDIGRTVAIKTIRWDLIQANIGPEEALQRFMQEMKIVGQLQHPNIVTLYDTGEADGNRYFVMEYVEGRTLASMIRTDGVPSLARAVQIIRSVANGLAYAHSRGVIHRDIKPSNVMISNEGQVKVTDFGIARCAAFAGNMTRSLTGTPKYISPEQVGGKQVDHRSDIFSLGVLAYELLTGESAFQGESLTEIIHQVVHDNPPPLSSINPAIPARLDEVVMKAMEKEPEDRYPDTNAFEQALVSAADAPATDGTVPGVIVPPPPSRKGWSSMFRRGLSLPRRPYVAGLILAVLIVLAALTSARFRWWESVKQTDVGQAYAQGIADARKGEIEAARSTFEKMIDEYDKRDKGLVGLAYISLRDGNDEEVLNLCSQALESNPQNLYARVLRATVFFQQQTPDQALGELMQALKTASGADWEESEAYTLLGRIQDLQGKTDEALTSYEEAIRLDPANSVAYTNKGTLLSRLGNYQGAVSSYQALLRVSDDPAARILANESQRKIDLQVDKEKHERIRKLVKDLDQQFKRRNKEEVARGTDPWSPRPLTVCVYPFEEEGTPSLDTSSGIIFQTSVFQEFEKESRLSLVNRQILDTILQELQLSQTELADREKALHVGQIAGANVIVTGTLFRLGERLQVVVQVIETETTYIKAALSEEQSRTETLLQFSDRTASTLSKAIVSAFPLKGRISEIKGEEIFVNFGQDVGAAEGMQFKVLPDEKEAGLRKKAFVGTITLTQVLEKSSVARLDAKYDAIQTGQRIIESWQEGAGSEGTAPEGA